MTACWPRARSAAAARAVIKSIPEDFQVFELPGFVADGEGEHLYLELRKTDLTTPMVADWLADCYDVPALAVGYAGMKDRRAVATQWFSVQTPHGPEALETALPEQSGVALLQSTRHRRKLRRGDLTGNRFELRLRDVDGPGWEDALAGLELAGAPNYFGPQRFGRSNLAEAQAWIARDRRRRAGGFRRALMLSVLRSFLFNEVLASRVRHGIWDVWLPGDVAAPAPTFEDRGSRAPSGPLWGRGRSPAEAAAAAVERWVLEAHGTVRDALEHAGLTQQRRSLLVRPRQFAWCRQGDTVEVTFSLGPGEYATVLLGEVFDLQPGAAGH